MKKSAKPGWRGDYSKDPALFQKVESVPGEQALYEKAREELKKELSVLRTATVIDFCCGTCEIFNRIIPEPKITRFIGVDIEPAYLDFAKTRLAGVAGAELVLGDAADCYLKAAADIVLASSAYHHIEDGRKMLFLQNIIRHMKPDGKVVFAENILPGYEDEKGHADAARVFYGKRIDEAKKTGMAKEVVWLLRQVMGYEVSREYEWKVDYRRFMADLDRVGFAILRKTKVWPTAFEFEDPLAGDYVIVADVPCGYM